MYFVITFLVTCILAWILTPSRSSEFAGVQRLSASQRPPRAGGFAVAIPVVALGFAQVLVHADVPEKLVALCAGALVVWFFGVIDDAVLELRPLGKLSGQALGVAVMVFLGLRTEIYFLPAWVNILLTVIWMLVLTNSINLLDILDGLAVGVVLLIALGFWFIAWQSGAAALAVFSAGLSGSCLAFYLFNRRPARIYLGDNGSQLLGFFLGGLALANSYATEANAIALLTPLVLLAIPLFDLLFVSWVRWRKGQSIVLKSPDHLSYRLAHLFRAEGGEVKVMHLLTLGFVLIGLVLPVAPALICGILIGIALVLLGAIAWAASRMEIHDIAHSN
ncbi:MAG: undecaprenyl/decaprenyl-phosphate alpha-N-acetylglucosaminyl 1-phosphate transferase [Candidatus Omnitrophica bacterium]|nr:undecaprenyl/decaprenyl-phosphate alpha-N-acetylglucosaminyl 1-phosphate transferase [Candidatus Omnitrophota bacterium]